MNTSAEKRKQGRALPRDTFKISPVAVGCGLLMAASGVFAQQPPAAAASAPAANTLDTVVVTGIRGGIEAAIETKKNSNSIVESISAEDIGKLPDTSIAEAISRLPGIAAQRTRGRASQISVRGMAPDYAATLLNGREQVTTGDSRGVEFDQFPGELISKVDIYKTPDAGLVGQGLSGTFNMQTARPLAYSQRAAAVNYRKQRLGIGTVAEGDGFRASASYIDQFADRKIGIALGFARLDETTGITERFDSWGGGTTTYNGATVNVPYNGFGLFADQTKQTRDGAMAVIQLKPTDALESTLDLYYSKFDQVKSTKGFQAPLNDNWLDAAGNGYDKPGSLINATLSGSNVTRGTFTNVRAVIRNDAEDLKDRLSSIGWNNKLKLGEGWRVEADLNRSTAKRKGQILETTAGVAQSTLNGAQMDTLTFTSDRGFTPGFNYTDRNIVKLTDVQGWGGGINSPQAGYSKLPNVNDELNSGKLSLHKTLKDHWLITGYEVGANYTQREKTRAYIEGRLEIASGTGGLASAALPGDSTMTLGGVSFATFDPTTAIGSIYRVATKLHPDIFNKDWNVTEKLSTGYGRADVDSELFGLPVRGNFGLQVIHTNQRSQGFNVDRGNCPSDQNCPALDTSGGTTYTDILPSLNLNFELGGDQVVRFGLARVMARANLNDMRASLGLSISQINQNGVSREIYTGDGGNPELKPTRANAVDLAYEKYFGKKAYVGIAGFYKDLRTYVLRQSVTYDFKDMITPSTRVLPSTIGAMSMPLNGNGGKIQGYELSASLPLNMLWAPLDGFGIQANHSYTDSSVKLAIAGVNVDGISIDIPLPGLSKSVGNLTFYYEKYGFSARVAARKRSDFIGEVSTVTGDRTYTYVKGDVVTDWQMGYEFGSGFLKGLSVVFQVNNTANEPFIRYANGPSDIRENTKYGKTYLFGVNYKL